MAFRRLLQLNRNFSPNNYNSFISSKGFSSCIVATRVSAGNRHVFPQRARDSELRFFERKRVNMHATYGVRFKSDISLEEILDYSPSQARVQPNNELMQDVMAQSTEATSHVAEVTGQSTEVTGQFAEVTGQFAEVTGQFAEVTGQIAVSWSSLGLCNYTPVGLIQSVYELLTVSADVSWIPAIFAVTVFYRLLIFPLHLMGLKNSIRMQNCSPQVKKLHEEMTVIRNMYGTNAALEVQKKIWKVYKDNNCSVSKGFLLPLCLFPYAISSFIAMRGMINLPLESLKTGGFFSFVDLTVPDPFYILPVLSAGLMLYSFEQGAETGSRVPAFIEFRLVFRSMTLLSALLLSTLPAGIQILIITAAMWSLLQMLVIRSPSFKKFFNVPVPNTPDVDVKPLTFRQIYERFTNFNRKIAQETNLRRWEKNKTKDSPAHTNQKTYDYNPKTQASQEQAWANEEMFKEELLRTQGISSTKKKKKKNTKNKRRRDFRGPHM